ncbi:AAA family ATPase [Nonlabens antarcticus]|uniref:AAA family ATPase n=1 Tax=Nonlabens antarcticus TaxID=392714 RepID=UPI0018912B3C|nr:ATP-binding protein [Nonlabens antarcticus]
MEKIPEQSDFSGIRIVLYGPESSGKSTLANQLARHYQVPEVPEFARDYLQQKFDVNGHICEYQDIIPIAIGQREAENLASLQADKLLICDTDILETYVYCQYYFNKIPQELENAARSSKCDLYLLKDIDTLWSPDDLRDRPGDRKELFDRFENTLKKFNQPYVLINQLGHQRFLNAVKAIDKLL